MLGSLPETITGNIKLLEEQKSETQDLMKKMIELRPELAPKPPATPSATQQQLAYEIITG